MSFYVPQRSIPAELTAAFVEEDSTLLISFVYVTVTASPAVNHPAVGSPTNHEPVSSVTEAVVLETISTVAKSKRGDNIAVQVVFDPQYQRLVEISVRPFAFDDVATVCDVLADVVRVFKQRPRMTDGGLFSIRASIQIATQHLPYLAREIRKAQKTKSSK